MELTYNNRVALVSGAGRGIGKEIALTLAKAGCTVICVSKNPSSCGGVADEINAAGGKAEAFAFDVSNAAEAKTACDSILKKYGAVDIIVNNAGITRDNLLMRMSDEEWESVISTNLSSCFYICRNLVRAMMGKRWGRIINITSVSGIAGNAGQANYSAAKAGIIGFTKTLARESIKLIIENLPKCYDDPEDLDAREKMAYAEYMAGLSYSNSGLGICHSIAHAVSGKFNIQHGIALALTLPAVLKFNMYSENAEEYKFICEAFGIKNIPSKKDEYCRLAIKEIDKFRNDFNVPKKLSDYGVKEEDLDILAVNSFEDACTASNPREATMTDIYMLLKKLL